MRSRTKFDLCIAMLLALAFIFTLQPAAGQGIYGRIAGTVTDQSGAVVPGVSVTVTNVRTQETRTLVTDELGNYVANNLLPSEYVVEAELPGFKKARRTGITVALDRASRVDIVLEVGEATEMVEVHAGVSMLHTEEPGLAQSLDVHNLPLLSGPAGRNYLSLALLATGTASQPGGGAALGNIRISGGRPRGEDYLLDGTSTQQIVFGGPVMVPAPEAVEEFKVETNAYPAEYGRVSGGVFVTATKGGGNQFHGTLYEFFRNDVLNARDFFVPSDPVTGQKGPKDPLRQNEFGFALGGPVVKDKLFFFGNYSGFRRRAAQVFINTQVPTAAFKRGDLSAISSPIKDPTTGEPFPGNQIPQNRFSPAAKNLLALWPDPNAGGFNYNRTDSGSSDFDKFDVRIDYNASTSDKLFFVYHFADPEFVSALPLPNPDAAASLGVTDQPKASTVGWNHIFSPNLINEFRFGWTQRDPNRVPGGFGRTHPSTFGIRSFPPGPDPPCTGGKCGTPIINVLGFWSLGGGSILFEPARVLQFTDSLAWVKGTHNFKVGTDLRFFKIDNLQPNDINGSFNFRKTSTGYPFSDFLLGLADTVSAQVVINLLKTESSAYAFFFQDAWKVRPGFTLSYGLRYQLDLPFKERTNNAGTVDRFTGEWQLYGRNAPRTAFDTDLNNWGPRLGFTWNPTGNFVIRGGYGVIYPGNTTRGRGGDLDDSPLNRAKTSFTGGNISIDKLGKLAGTTVDASGNVVARIDDEKAVLAATKSFANSSDRNDRQQYMQQWNLTLENEMFENYLFSVSYAGSKGTKLLGNWWSNIYQLSEKQVKAGVCGVCFQGDGPLGPPGNAAISYLEPNFDGNSSSIYHSAQFKVEKRFSSGLGFLGSYTVSKLIDDASSDWAGFWELDQPAQDYLNRRADRSVSAGDVPQKFTFSFVWELPFGPRKARLNTGLASQVLGGWAVSGITTLQSGLPFGTLDECLGFCNNARSWATRPFMVGDPHLPTDQRSPERFINKDAFDFSNSFKFDTSRPFGNAPRFDDHNRGPGMTRFDFAFIKSTGLPFLGEQGRLDFRTELINAFNTPILSMPRFGSFDGKFGSITSTAQSNRNIQFGLKILF